MMKVGSLTALAVAVALLAALLSFRPVQAEGPAITIDSLHAGPGGGAKVLLHATKLPDPGLAAWTVDVHYNPERLTVADCTAEHGGICNASFSANSIRVAGTNLAGISGDTVLASIEFVCKNPGDSALDVQIDILADATPGAPHEFEASAHDGVAVCKAAEPTATPTAKPMPTPTPPPHEFLPGDVDCDGDVDTIDAVLILQLEAGLLHELPCLKNADVNDDGQVNVLDATLVLQIVAGLID
jgi:hypothetical protein